MNQQQVALLIETSTSWGTNIVKGIADYALTRANWYFHLEPRGKYEQLGLPSGWNGDGIIARVTHEGLAQEIRAARIPAVNVSWYKLGAGDVPSVNADEMQAGRMAAQHFLERGFQRFAYVGPYNRPAYTDLFGHAYSQAIRDADFDCILLEEDFEAAQVPDLPARTRRIAEWAAKLPKPIAVLAFSDIDGRQVADACRMKRIAIPEEIALLGGEHDELTAQISRPPLSSIDLCPQRIGWEAARVLQEMMDGKPPPREPVRLPPLRIISRQSTDAHAVDDPEIVRALRYILSHANEPITVNHVLATVTLSRRVLEQRFRRLLGRSPASEIRRVRVERVKQLLVDTELSMAQISSACGFEHPEVLTRVFRRHVGVTPSDFRKQGRT